MRATLTSSTHARRRARGRLGGRIACALLGHDVDNRVFATTPGPTQCVGCGTAILHEDGTETRIRHDVRCYLVHHEYVTMGERDLHNEYVCRKCGHTLLFEQSCDPNATAGQFDRRARYLCNLFGHRVHKVGDRDGYVEYACSTCGHPFLKAERALQSVTHPPINLFIGHFVRFVARRSGHAEHRCRHSGHVFSFATLRR